MQIQLLNVPYHCGCDSQHFHCKKCGGKVIPVSLYIMLSNTYNIAMERDSCRIKFGRVPTCYNWQVPNTSNESRTRPDELQVPLHGYSLFRCISLVLFFVFND